ncbi:2'-5' RNA ligase family protein [Candidatus Uhrbacteria bacterium]|nr:2'-5' RNA ligase family protein [Candidatus Uhrbacteria bacterium]
MHDTFALFGLVDEKSGRRIDAARQRLSLKTGNDRALRFPPHVTIVGRVRAERRRMKEVAEPLLLSLARLAAEPQELALGSPSFVPPDLLWLPVSSSSVLKGLHETAKDRLDQITEDLMDPSFQRTGYQPHITLGWGVTSDASEPLLDASLPRVTMVALAVALYPETWENYGKVRVWRTAEL